MDELIRKMIRDLRKEVEKKVPEEGYFHTVYAVCENPDKKSGLSYLLLKVVADEDLEYAAQKRFLEFTIQKALCPYANTRPIAYGTKQLLLDALQDEETVSRTIIEAIPQMVEALDDI